MKAVWIGIVLFALIPCTVREDVGLKDHFEGDFYIGAALSYDQVSDGHSSFPLLGKHFSSLSPENGLKWQPVHPQKDTYNFAFGDAYVALGEKLNAFVIGHTLVWHQQTPGWVYRDSAGEFLEKEELLSRMRDHIQTVVGRYKGRIHGWDVVNEVFEEDGSYRQSHWFTLAGKDFIKEAFRQAHQADPEAELYYNDYNVWRADKRKAILDLAKELRAEGLRIDGIGMQGHYLLESPEIALIEDAILEISEAGFQVMVTELDVDVLPRPRNSEGADLNQNFAESPEFNPYTEGLPPAVEEKLGERYKELFTLFNKHKEHISRVTFWGLHDGKSWLNNFPVRGRTNYPLLFDRNMNPKESVMDKILAIPTD